MEKIDFSEIAGKRIEESEVFTRRFGSFSKADFEVLMFTIYLDSIKEPIRDYDISIALGITETKVRNLRIRSQLLYPRELNWVGELSKSVEHGHYDPLTGQITVVVEDPSVLNYVKNKIETQFGVVGRSLNAKHLVLPVESFILLATCAEAEPEETIKLLNKHLRDETKDKGKIEKEKFTNRFLKGVPDMVSFISGCLPIFEVGKQLVCEVIKLIAP